MNKIRRIWFWIFLTIFLLPEILWSPIGNFLFSLINPTENGSIKLLRDNFLTNSDNSSYYFVVLVIQLLGIIGLLFTITKMKLNKITKTCIFILLTLIGLIVVFLTYILFATRNGIGF